MSLNLHLGSRYSRFESLSRLIGEGGRSDLLAVAVAKHEQEFDARTLQDHVSPHTASDLLYKNALDDRARTIFGGLIRVEPHAHFTDAYQKVRNLLLSDDAEANSMPGLEILADNVQLHATARLPARSTKTSFSIFAHAAFRYPWPSVSLSQGFWMKSFNASIIRQYLSIYVG